MNEWAGLMPESMTIDALADHCRKHERLNPELVRAFCVKNVVQLSQPIPESDGGGLWFWAENVRVSNQRVLGPDGKPRQATFSAALPVVKPRIDCGRQLVSIQEFERLWLESGKRVLSWFKKEPTEKPKRELEINSWLRQKWLDLGKPGGADLFRALKREKGKPGSPIHEWYASGQKAGITYRTSAGAEKTLSKKSIENKAGDFKKQHLQD